MHYFSLFVFSFESFFIYSSLLIFTKNVNDSRLLFYPREKDLGGASVRQLDQSPINTHLVLEPAQAQSTITATGYSL